MSVKPWQEKFSSLVLALSLALGYTTISIIKPRYAMGAEKLKFVTPVKTSALFFLLPLAAEERGFWKEQGVEAEWFPFSAGRAMNEAVAAGSVSIGLNMAVGVIRSAAFGIPEVMVADLSAKSLWYFWVLKDSPIKGARDFKATKVGVTRTGSVSHGYALAVIRSLGFEKDIKVVATGGVRQAIAALKAGVVNSIILSRLLMIKLELEGHVRRALSLAEFLADDGSNVTMFARRNLIEKDPNTVRRVVRGILKSSAFVNNNPRWVVNEVKSRLGMYDRAAQEVHRILRFSTDGKIRVKELRNIRKFLIEFGATPKTKTPPVEKIYSSKFVPVE